MSTPVEPIVPAVAAEWRPRFNPWAIAITVTLATYEFVTCLRAAAPE